MDKFDIEFWELLKIAEPKFIKNEKGLYINHLDDQRKLIGIDKRYISEELGIPRKKLTAVLKNEETLRIDLMIKLCHFLMMPSVEYAFNLNNAIKNISEEDRGIVHQKIVDMYGTYNYNATKYNKFVQDLYIDKKTQKYLLNSNVISYIKLYRIIHNKMIAKTNTALEIVFALNKSPLKMEGVDFEISDFWNWEIEEEGDKNEDNEPS